MKIKVIEILSPKQGMKQDILKGIIIEGKPKLAAVYELVEYKSQTDQQRKLFNPYNINGNWYWFSCIIYG